jgi:hypothetical protein
LRVQKVAERVSGTSFATTSSALRSKSGGFARMGIASRWSRVDERTASVFRVADSRSSRYDADAGASPQNGSLLELLAIRLDDGLDGLPRRRIGVA